jgi:pyrimidine-nucleoside phosphorylase
VIAQWLIEKKRDGGALTPDEIRAVVQAYTDGTLPEYQMAALAMAIYFRGMTTTETATLTDAMLRSGELLDFSDAPCPTVDKHSTGGIGDKISLILAPLAASAGLAVPMIAGRGLGITGGTLDKLEAIPGFRIHLPVAEFQRIVRTVGCAIIGQTEQLAPADRKLYALRDVTATVPSIPLITASILSKKLAEGTAALVFDVKFGRGAFLRTPEEARLLACSLLDTSRSMGRRVAALLTNMEQPLGRTAGNAVEVQEALDVLHGGGPDDVRDLTLLLAAHMTLLAGIHTDKVQALQDLGRRLDDGRAWDVFRKMVAAQGGDLRAIDEPSAHLPHAAVVREVPAPQTGYVQFVDAEKIGRLVLQLGAGRTRTEDKIDITAGVDALVRAGDLVAQGQPLMRLHAAAPDRVASLLTSATDAITLGATPPPPVPLVLETLT